MNPTKQFTFSTLLLLSFFFLSKNLSAQFRVLLYTETGGYNHGTEQVSKTLFDSLGLAHNFSVDLDNTGAIFSEYDSLINYEIIIWANTSGANILTLAQQDNFEKYMAAGGNMMGIHAATDTYRHSSANGNHTGHWDWYAETLGASVQEGPNHTSNLHVNFLDHMTTHKALDSLPNPWEHAEEYYYWENGYFDSLNNHVLLRVRQTDRSGSVNSYDSARAVSWIKDNIGGGQAFYTSLGHNKSSYEKDSNFKIHLRDAILALSAPPASILEIREGNRDFSSKKSEVRILGNPFTDKLAFSLHNMEKGEFQVEILDLRGASLHQEIVLVEENIVEHRFNTQNFVSGLYLLKVSSKDYTFAQRIVKY